MNFHINLLLRKVSGLVLMLLIGGDAVAGQFGESLPAHQWREMLEQIHGIVGGNALKDFRQLRGVERAQQIRQACLLDFGEHGGGFVGGQLPEQRAGIVGVEPLQPVRQIGGVQLEIRLKKDGVGFRHRISGLKR